MPAEPAGPPPVLFVGLGSSHGDDAVGWAVADSLSRRTQGTLTIRKALAPIDLLDWLEPDVRLAVCDGCQGLDSGEAWRRWIWPDLDASLRHAASVHDFSLHGVLELADRLGRLKLAPAVWGIEVRDCVPATAPNAALAAVVDEVVDDVLAFLAEAHEESACTKPRW